MIVSGNICDKPLFCRFQRQKPRFVSRVSIPSSDILGGYIKSLWPIGVKDSFPELFGGILMHLTEHDVMKVK